MANGKRTLTGSISSGQTLTGSVKGGSGTTDHSRLINRAEPDQHPIEAITGLRPELDSKINSTTALLLIEEATKEAASDATSKANAAEIRAKAYADYQDAALKTALEGGDTDTTYDKTIKGAKDYAKDYADTQDATTLESAQTYADTAAANAVKTDITVGNADIVITRPTEGADTGKSVISHKDYSAGTFTKTPVSLTKTNDTYFFKSIAVSNGHITGGEMQSLAEALSAMTFIFDGGTSTN
jgi:hypothetical protein